jgi:hypothetical protein
MVVVSALFTALFLSPILFGLLTAGGIVLLAGVPEGLVIKEGTSRTTWEKARRAKAEPSGPRERAGRHFRSISFL